MSEDFAREEVEQYAKGVLFGNAFRLQSPESRGDPFTPKCLTAGARLGAALVSTPDLFAVARYLKEFHDPDYARACRTAIFETSGEVVQFPEPPRTKPKKVSVKEVREGANVSKET
ncbi:MAG: hypothetical protein ACRED5_06520 [Propylenella sp.]